MKERMYVDMTDTVIEKTPKMSNAEIKEYFDIEKSLQSQQYGQRFLFMEYFSVILNLMLLMFKCSVWEIN